MFLLAIMKRTCWIIRLFILVFAKCSISFEKRRRSLSKENEYLNDKDVLYIFSKSMVEKLLANAKPKKTIGLTTMASAEPVVTVERRASVLSLTAGETTLEYALPCPPVCSE